MTALAITNETTQLSAVEDDAPIPMDRATFSQEVRTHHRRLLAYASSLLEDTASAGDVVQEALVTAYRNLGRFDISRDFGAWLRGIVRNKCREELRKKRPLFFEEDVLESIELLHRDWEELDTNGGSGLFLDLEDCLAHLDPPQKEVVDLFYYEGCSGDETSTRLDLSAGSVRKRLQRARESLRNCLQGKGRTSN